MTFRNAIGLLGACAIVIGLVGYGGAAALAATTFPGQTVSQAAPATVLTFGTPGTFTWTVPPGVTQATFEVSGAQGGAGGGVDGGIGGPGGLGGNALVTIAVLAGTTYQINIGGPGASRAVYPDGGGGGGASDVRTGSFALTDRVIVGGGGGGGGGADRAISPGGLGGGGGGSSGVAGANGLDVVGKSGDGGGGGSQAAGGSGGNSSGCGGSAGMTGAFAQGGSGAESPAAAGGINGGGRGGTALHCDSGGGGGGGGYYGGGGGGAGSQSAAGGGGGGSGFGPAGTVFLTGVRAGDGLVIIAFVAPPPLPTTTDQCKNGGWKTFGVFKNQGDCVSFVATVGKNLPALP